MGFGADKLAVDPLGRGEINIIDYGSFPAFLELLNALMTIPADIGFPFVGVTSTADINLGAAGAIGDYLGDISIHNGSGSNITQISIKDGSTEMVGLRYTTAIATATGITIPGPRTRSVNGGWKVAITCAGTMASINGYARGRLS